jgi:hypothetical protein
MGKKCVLCEENIFEQFGKLFGTLIKSKDEKGMTNLIFVCAHCQKTPDWINNAKIKGA